MKIESPVLGSVEIADDKLLEFPAGLAGFEDYVVSRCCMTRKDNGKPVLLAVGRHARFCWSARQFYGAPGHQYGNPPWFAEGSQPCRL